MNSIRTLQDYRVVIFTLDDLILNLNQIRYYFSTELYPEKFGIYTYQEFIHEYENSNAMYESLEYHVAHSIITSIEAYLLNPKKQHNIIVNKNILSIFNTLIERNIKIILFTSYKEIEKIPQIQELLHTIDQIIYISNQEHFIQTSYDLIKTIYDLYILQPHQLLYVTSNSNIYNFPLTPNIDYAYIEQNHSCIESVQNHHILSFHNIIELIKYLSPVDYTKISKSNHSLEDFLDNDTSMVNPHYCFNDIQIDIREYLHQSKVNKNQPFQKQVDSVLQNIYNRHNIKSNIPVQSQYSSYQKKQEPIQTNSNTNNELIPIDLNQEKNLKDENTKISNDLQINTNQFNHETKTINECKNSNVISIDKEITKKSNFVLLKDKFQLFYQNFIEHNNNNTNQELANNPLDINNLEQNKAKNISILLKIYNYVFFSLFVSIANTIIGVSFLGLSYMAFLPVLNKVKIIKWLIDFFVIIIPKLLLSIFDIIPLLPSSKHLIPNTTELFSQYVSLIIILSFGMWIIYLLKYFKKQSINID